MKNTCGGNTCCVSTNAKAVGEFASTRPICSNSGTGSVVVTRCGLAIGCPLFCPSVSTTCRAAFRRARDGRKHFLHHSGGEKPTHSGWRYYIWYNNTLFGAENRSHSCRMTSIRTARRSLPAGNMNPTVNVDRNGNAVDYQTGPIIWGEPAPTVSTRFIN